MSLKTKNMNMLFESSFSFCTQHVTTRLQSGETATAVEAQVARQSGRAASAGGHHGGPRRATRRSHPDSPGCGFFFSRSGTTADGSRQQQHKIGKNARS
jgi:hypothetical protein